MAYDNLKKDDDGQQGEGNAFDQVLGSNSEQGVAVPPLSKGYVPIPPFNKEKEEEKGES